jgi:hypothetical protein
MARRENTARAFPGPFPKAPPPPEFLRRAPLALRELIMEHERIIRHQEYKPLGKLVSLLTAAGAMEFRNAGPMIGVSAAGDLLLLSSWTGLPELRESSDDFCDACLVKCDTCAGEGKKTCSAPGCGGAGKLRGGKECGECQGSGIAACAACRGTGQRPNGRQDGGTSMAAVCTKCGGTERRGKNVKQDLARFAQGEISGMIALGPIVQVTFYTLGQQSRFVQSAIAPDIEQRQASLLLHGARGYFVGGIPLLPPELMPG